MTGGPRRLVARARDRRRPSARASRWTAEDLLYLLYTSRHDREAEGDRPHDRRLPRRRRDDPPLRLRRQARDATSTGARPTSAGSPATATSSTARSATATTGVMYEGTPDFPDKDRWWDDRRALRRDDPLHGADRDPRAHEVGAGVRGAARPLVAAAARLGRRADQPRGVDLVPRAHRRRPLPDRRHVVADRDRDDPDHAAARGHDDEAGLGDEAVPRGRRGRRTTSRGTRSARAAAGTSCCGGRGRRCCAGSTATTSGTATTYWSRFPGVYFAGDGARIDARRRLLAPRPRRRRDERLRATGSRRSRSSRRWSTTRRSRRRRSAGAQRRADRPGDRRVRDAARAGSEGSVEKLEELRDHVAQKIGPIAKPANIVFTPELPKTRSGKIMRRLLRDVAENRPLGDTTTLADPAVVEEIRTRGETRTTSRRSDARATPAVAARNRR